MKDWFVVDKNGLKQLQAGKKKTFIINELVQNAFDEDITFCKVDITQPQPNKIKIKVKDDNPEGFKDITHAYTLFADTYKRRDATKRGRFNLGEKQVISICDNAEVQTTKGTIVFDERGRTEMNETTGQGSIITVVFDGDDDEFKELIEHTKTLIAPAKIRFIVNGLLMQSKDPQYTIKASLMTEILKDDVMKNTHRKTSIHLIPSNGKSYIYEMGIPIVKTDCPWNIDVQQKIPLAVDRQTIQPFYYKDLYAEILNHTYQELSEETCSDLWVRTGMKDERIKKEAVQAIFQKRFGGKFLSSNPFDPNANDEAISKGYRVITGSEMSKEEWAKAKDMGLIHSTTEIFGEKNELRNGTPMDLTDDMKRWSAFCRKVAKEFLGVDNLQVRFVSDSYAKARASYYPSLSPRMISFNMALLGKTFFKTINQNNINLLIHELGHEEGNHTEHSYHDCITRLAGLLIMKAKQDPKYFEYN